MPFLKQYEFDIERENFPSGHSPVHKRNFRKKNNREGFRFFKNKNKLCSKTCGPTPPPPIKRRKKVYSMIILNNNIIIIIINNNNKKKNLNGDHYLTCRLPPQVKREKL